MDDGRTSDVLENIDRRLANVEQILPALSTRDEMHAAIRAAVAPLPTRDEMHAAIQAAVAPLPTRDEMHAAIQAAVAPLPTRDEMRATVQEEGERSRRYMQVLTEGLRDDIRLLAEGHLALDRRDAAQHAETTARLDTLEFRVAHPTRPRPAG